MKKIIIYADDEKQFVAEPGCRYTRNLYQAMEFDSVEEADKYANIEFPCESVTFLTIVNPLLV